MRYRPLTDIYPVGYPWLPVEAEVRQELQHIRQRLERLEQQGNTLCWPLYTAQATEEDKQTFEKMLRKLCQSRSRSHSRDVKLYLTQKEKAGLIIRPTELKQEHTILSDLFGYQPTYSAYHNA